SKSVQPEKNNVAFAKVLRTPSPRHLIGYHRLPTSNDCVDHTGRYLQESLLYPKAKLGLPS
ncbi:MAG: hypothetical protein ACK42H_06690, partial [Planctomycetota bacterium]